MGTESIEQRVFILVGDQMNGPHLDVPPITRATRFREDLNCDSLDECELLMEAENTFEVSILDEDAQKFVTVGDAIDYITKRLADSRAKTGS